MVVFVCLSLTGGVLCMWFMMGHGWNAPVWWASPYASYNDNYILPAKDFLFELNVCIYECKCRSPACWLTLATALFIRYFFGSMRKYNQSQDRTSTVQVFHVVASLILSLFDFIGRLVNIASGGSNAIIGLAGPASAYLFYISCEYRSGLADMLKQAAGPAMSLTAPTAGTKRSSVKAQA